MIQVFRATGGTIEQLDSIAGSGIWINVVNPSEEELITVSSGVGVDLDFLRAALDEEERPRIESENDQVLVLVGVPVTEGTNGNLLYDTLPLGVVVNHRALVTVCLQETPILADFQKGRVRSLSTAKRTRFLFQILFRTATLYLRYLRDVDKRTSAIEKRLQRSQRNSELIRLLNLEKTLVYFTTALRSNHIVMEKLMRSKLGRPGAESGETPPVLAIYAEDEDLLEDVITENKQAMEMCEIYSGILSGMMDAFASVISNNLNIVMKFLTSVTILLSLPMLLTSFFGMNVALPFQSNPNAFLWIIAGSLALSGAVGLYLARRDMI